MDLPNSSKPAATAAESQAEAASKNLDRRKSVAAERYDPSLEADESFERIVHPKTDSQRQRLQDAIGKVFLLRTLDREQMQDVVDAMFEKKVSENEHIIEQGEDGDNFYVIESGLYEVFTELGTSAKPVASYDNQGSFGELALMYNMPRSASIIAKTPGSLWALDRSTFRKIVLRSTYRKRKEYESLLQTVPILNTLTDFERVNVADALICQAFAADDCIIKQGDSANGMYFIEEGTVRVSAKDELGHHELTKLSKGQYFGEMALVNHQPRSASVYAVTDVNLAFLEKAAFERLLGPCVELMKRKFNEYEEDISKQVESTKIS